MAFFNDDISINSIVGAGSFISGDVNVNGFAKVDGDIRGNLVSSGNVIVGKNSRILGDITAKSVTIGGIVKGNILAPEGVHLLSTSAVLGNIQTKRFQADDNVILHGHCIALSDPEKYQEACEKWENQTAISSKSIFRSSRD